MIHSARKSIALAAVLASFAGCGGGGGGGDEKVVASAGELRVTLAEFNDAWNRITPNYRPDISTLEGKRSFANDLINRAILLEEASRAGGISDPATMKQIDGVRNNAMLQRLYRNEVEAKVDVLGKHVAELYENRKTKVKASHVLLDDVETARRIRNDIVSGKITFEDAARKHSLDQSTRQQGGSLGEIVWAFNSPPFHRKALEMKAGELSEPFESEFGVHLIRVEERIPQELAPLEEMRPSLRPDARRQLEIVRMREFVRSLEEQANLTWNQEGLDRLMELIEVDVARDIDTIPREEQHVPPATPEQRATTLATFGDRAWTIGDYVDFLRAQPPPNRPVTRLPARALQELIRTTQIQNELLLAEARARGYAEDPEVAAADQRLREQVLMNLVHSRFLQVADVPEEDARAVYDSVLAASPENVMVPERVDMLVLVHPEEKVVREGLRRIRAGEPEADVIAELSVDFRTKSNGGRTGLVARGNYAPQLEDVAFSERVGKGWSEPIVTESGTGAVKVLAHEPSRQATFEEMKQPLIQNLAQARGETAFEEWLVTRREELGVEIHDDVLELIGQSVS